MSKNPEAIRLGQNIKSKREKAGLTQRQLANRLACHLRHVQRIEAGQTNVTLNSMCVIARVLKVQLWILTMGVEDFVVMPEARPDPKRVRKPSLPTVIEEKQSLAKSWIRHDRALVPSAFDAKGKDD